MSAVIIILILVNYTSICYQDFKSREVYLANYISLYLLYIFLFYASELQIITETILLNTCIVFATVSLLATYYLLRYRIIALKKIKSSIGIGDLLIIPVFIISFTPFNFILIYIISLLASLTYFVVAGYYKKEITIPLAGIQSVILAVCLVLNYTGIVNLHTDIYPLL